MRAVEAGRRVRARRLSVLAAAAVVVVLSCAVALPGSGRAGAARVVATAPAPRGAPMRFGGTGFFRTQFDGRRWWLVTPDGRPFYVSGVNHVSASPDTDRVTGVCPYCEAIASKYASVDAWANVTVQRLRSWGFNTVSSWSDIDRFASRMPYTMLLSMASGSDWFSPEFVSHARAAAQESVLSRRDDPNLIGWILDSELRWSADWRSATSLLVDYLALPPGSPGRKIAQRYVGDPNGFLRVLADRYFRVTTTAIRGVDPHHLILGVKMIAQLTPAEVLQAARPYVDVWTVDDYTLLPGLDALINTTWGPFVNVDGALAADYGTVGKPILITEYSFRASDAGVPNSWPPIYPTYASQQQRADAYEAFVRPLYEAPWIVGDVWFEYVDEPAGGRFDGEDSNFGLVSNTDTPWQTLVDRMTNVHADAPDRTLDVTPCWSWQPVGRSHHVQCIDPPN